MTNLSFLRPLRGRMLVRRTRRERITAGGILIPETAQTPSYEGTIVAIGLLESGDLKVGDRIFFSRVTRHGGAEIENEEDSPVVVKLESTSHVDLPDTNGQYLVVWEDDVLAVVVAE